MPRYFAFFFLLQPLAKNVFIFCVGLREVVVTEALAKLQLTATLRIAHCHHFEPPFNFRGRPLSSSAKILFILDLQLANVALELVLLLVNRDSGGGRYGHAGHPLTNMLEAAPAPVNGTRAVSCESRSEERRVGK